ncbi:MAG TPA: mannosyltransferase family protein [Pyrinomonadaceae bacterium]|nr:mannosyltransferase family protein [Pyrinomonadaceae bacterium]
MSKRIADVLKKNEWLNPNVILICLLVKTMLLVYGYHSYEVFVDKPFDDFNSYLKIWTRWDAESYLNIAEFGYVDEGPKRFLLVFFPLYPLLTSLTARFVQNYILSAFIISGVASVALAISFRSLVKLDFSQKTAQKAVLFLFIFPTSYFLHIPYTESLFLALTIGCFWAARTNKWVLAGILGMLACQSRINGIILLPALLFEIWEQYKESRITNWRWSSICMIPLGFISYLILNYAVSGKPLMFLEYQRENWGKYLQLPFEGLWGKFRTIIDQSPANSNMVGFQELLFVAIGFLSIVFAWKYLRRSYLVWLIANWILFVSTSFILSVPRYTLTMFPIFILMSIASQRDWKIDVLFTTWSILYLALFTSLFVKGHWAF